MPGAGRLLALAFDPEVRPADDLPAERILDAALQLAGASGLRRLTMDEVARRAGVGRMTVYRRFGSRGALVDALAVRECRRCLEAIAAAASPERPLEERIAAQALVALRLIREHPLLHRLARFEPEDLARELARPDSEVVALVRAFLIAQIEGAQARGELRDGDPQLLAELALRLAASFVLIPSSAIPLDDEAALRALIAPLVAPG
jgi:TetR/AcrR family transcriptional repressor of uid operon